MKAKVLLCDIGNTTLKFGFADCSATYTFPTRPDATADSLGLRLAGALKHGGITQVEICIAASVVPALDYTLKQAVTKYLGCQTLFVPNDLPVPLENHYSRPQEVGADIIVGAYSARLVFPEAPSLIVVDFGTAATFACVEHNAFTGGLIFPGPATAASALASHTAKLPHVSLTMEDREAAPGQDTATSIRHGLILGYACLTEGLCNMLRRQLQEPVKLIATGGFSKILSQRLNIFDAVLPDLVLNGLAALYQTRNQAH